ncbi:unnamed protein product [Sphagnum troendelagicum]|uniref:Uncharacterized protein n=1 Tax=Sphagnum troendelagicum TaxID=128251 RepID=A0ABP0URR3_9BRYO
MRLKAQRYGGGFPGYNGPALPRAMRSSRGRAESVRLQSTGGAQSGVFELLATVAGQFLQDDGSKKEDQNNEVKLGCHEPLDQQKLILEMNSQVPYTECVMNYLVAQEQQITVTPSIASQVDTLKEVRMKEEPEEVDREDKKEGGGEHVKSHPITVTNKSALWIPAQDKEDEVIAKDIPVKEGMAASVQNKSTELADQVFLLQSDSALSTAKFDQNLGTASVAVKERMHVPEVQGGGTEMEQCSAGKLPETEEITEGMPMQTMETVKLMSLMSSKDSHSSPLDIELLPLIQQEEKQLSPSTESNELVEGLLEDLECPKALGKFEAGTEPAHGGDVTLETGLFQVQCKTSASGEVVEPAKPIDASIIKTEEKITVKVEEKNPHLLTGVTSFMVTTSGLEGGHNTRAMFKRVKSNRDAKFFNQETIRHLRSSPRLVQETMTKRLKNSFSKGLKSRRAANKVLKSSPVSGRRRKRKHVDTESADSGSSGAKAASVASSPTAKGVSRRSSKKSCEPHVKLSIKSFAVPELFVDLPESASVANLKRAVMDAAMSLLGGGLRVRVLMQGKKVPDEGATLLQMGISRTARPESLDFMLEPSPLPSSPSTIPEDPLLVLSHATNQPSLRSGTLGHTKGSPDEHDNIDTKEAGCTFSVAPDTSLKGFNRSKKKSTVTERIPRESLVAGSGAIILHPGMGTGDDLTAMALVPLRQKITQALDIGKRRVRRPFSVTEVEALVHSVEKLGTGRWRDIKLRSFDQAKHRTYVDLKDKWKTLVHTAQIAPHQRRGETVPQELLERVIRIHTYWTAQAAKQQAELDF